MSKAKKVALGVGVGLGVAAASAAGYYFFGSKNAKKNRAQAAVWANKLKKDVVARAKKLKVMDEKAMKKVVTEASRAYAAMKSVDKRELKKAVKELHDNWQAVMKEASTTGKKVARAAKKSVVKKK